MAEDKSSLQKAIEQMLARTKLTPSQNSPQAQINAQMSAQDPSFSAGALVGQLLGAYLRNRFQAHKDRRDEEELEKLTQPSLGGGQDSLSSAAPSDAGLAAGRQALPVDTNALQQQFLGNLNDNSALAQAANNQYVNAPFGEEYDPRKQNWFYRR